MAKKKVIDFSFEVVDEKFNLILVTPNGRYKVKRHSYLHEVVIDIVDSHRAKEKEDDEVIDNIVSYANNLLEGYKSVNGVLTFKDRRIFVYKEEKLRCKLGVGIASTSALDELNHQSGIVKVNYNYTIVDEKDIILYHYFWNPVIKRKNK